MPVSSSDGRGKWKRRKREPPVSRKLSRRDGALEEDDEDDGVEDDANNTTNRCISNNNHIGGKSDRVALEDPHNPQLTGFSVSNLKGVEVVADCPVRICDFPTITRMPVVGAQSSVLAVVAQERANSGTGGQGQVLGLTLENVSYGQLQSLSAVPVECLRFDPDSGSPPWVISPPPIMDGKGVVKRFWSRIHVVPMHSDWFSPAIVHRLERQVVPHFFSGKSPEHTPEKYMECRNHILAKYMVNPEKRIEVSDCHGLVADVEDDDVARILRFLDHWGIVNYCVSPTVKEAWNAGSYIKEDSNCEVHVPSAALKSLDSLIKFDKPKCRLKAADVYDLPSIYDDDCSDLDSRIREHLSDNRCHCCSNPITNPHYQSHKEVDILLCTGCFHEGKFVVGHSSLDFCMVDARKDYGDFDGDTWSDQETLLLLEAMEIFNDNWNEIADYVGTKSKAQCILHFLRLPIEDGLLDNIEVPLFSELSNGDNNQRLSSHINASCTDKDETDGKLPFENAGNPLMALVAFLSYAIGPRVAAACAHASLASLSEDPRSGSAKFNGRECNTVEGNSVKQRDDFRNSLQGVSELECTPLTAEKVKSAAKVGLSAAAMKAKLFADHEEREIQRLSANIINHQLKRLELKLKQFAEVETFLMRECEQVEKTRQRFAAERARLQSTQVSSAVAPSTLLNSDPNVSRPQLIPANPSQPNSVYASNQQVRPQVPFMQRGLQQAMLPMGPRLPLSAIQPSSVPSNTGFTPTGNPQTNLNHMLRTVSGPRSTLG